MPHKNRYIRDMRLQEIGKILMEHPKHNSINRTMSQLYQTHKRLGFSKTFDLNRRFYKRLL